MVGEEEETSQLPPEWALKLQVKRKGHWCNESFRHIELPTPIPPDSLSNALGPLAEQRF